MRQFDIGYNFTHDEITYPFRSKNLKILSIEELFESFPDQRFNIDPSAQISSSAIVSDKVSIGKNVQIDHHAIIEDYSIIGEGTYVGPRVVIGARGLKNDIYKKKDFKLRRWEMKKQSITIGITLVLIFISLGGCAENQNAEYW